jgi:hypothetical protein
MGWRGLYPVFGQGVSYTFSPVANRCLQLILDVDNGRPAKVYYLCFVKDPRNQSSKEYKLATCFSVFTAVV